ncbi:hypothetical protein Tco_0040502, partial [Tanacetum coccineum]
MAERTMEELLRAPTEGYGEAIVLPEINADHFEIKTNLLQLVQANPFYGRESENPHAHINSFKRITSTLRFRNVPNDVIKLMMFPYSLEGAAKTWYEKEPPNSILTWEDLVTKFVVERETEETTDKEQTNFQGSTAQIPPPVIPISIPEPDVPKSLPKTTPILESDVPKNLPKPNIPYPSRRDNQKSCDKASNQMEKIFQIFQDLRFDISFADALLLMPRFAPTIKSLLMNKEKLLELAKIPLNKNCSAMLLKKLPEKLGDPGKFLIPCNFSRMDLADRSITHPKGLAEDIYVKVGKFHFPTDFVVVDFEADPRVPLILVRSFLRIGRSAIIIVNGEEITPFSLHRRLIMPIGDPENKFCLIKKLLNNDPFQLPPMDLKQSEVTKAKSSIEEPPELELKDLPSHLEYAYLEENDKLPVIIAKGLKDDEKEALLKVLKSHKRAIAWKITDIKGIDPRFCTHKILMEDDYKPTVQSQRRVNPKIHE